MFGFLAAKYYYFVYLVIVSILTFFAIRRYGVYGLERISLNEEENPLALIFLAAFMVLFIGFRPVSGVFMDMGGYAMMWDYYSDPNFHFDIHAENFLFDNLRFFMSSAGFGYTEFFVLISLIYFACMAWACSILFPNDRFIAFLVCLAAFSTFSYGTNGIKAGSAASVFLVALAMKDKGKIIPSIIFLVFSLGFHHSMVLPIASFAVCYFIKNPRIYVLFWIFSFFIALFHIKYFQTVFAGFVDEHSSEYLLGREGNHEIFGGFRIDFIMYSAVPIFVGQFLISSYKIKDSCYLFILNLYTFVNAMWLLCMYASYTNRIAYLGWLMYPIVLIYPFLRLKIWEGQYRTFRTVAILHLCFTLFMHFVYYA